MKPQVDLFLFVFWRKLTYSKGTFNSESAVDMSNRHIKVPKIAPALLFPINGMNCSEKILIF